MGQYWDLVNFDKRRTKYGGGKLGEFLFHGGLPLAIHHFTIPTWPEEDITRILESLPSSSKYGAKVLQLPVELVNEVFNQLTDLKDAVSLCLTDVLLFRIGFPRVQVLHRAAHASWAGDRVLCLGDSSADNGFPASVQELVYEEIKRCQIPKQDGYAFHKVLNTYTGLWKSSDPYTPDTMQYSYYSSETVKRDGRFFDYLCSAHYISDHPWVLCNLSKGQYVRAQAIRDLLRNVDELSQMDDGPFIFSRIDLGVALLIRICWSTSCATNIRKEDHRMLHQGPWAGDRFEVTTMDRMSTGKDWQDVSEEVIDEICEVLEHY